MDPCMLDLVKILMRANLCIIKEKVLNTHAYVDLYV